MERYKFLTDQKRREYGAVMKLTMDGNLAVPIQWREGRTKLELLVHKDRLVVRQDGQLLGQTRVAAMPLNSLRQPQVRWKRGIFGPCRCTVHSKSVTP